MNLKIVEPLNLLFKDEVRRVGKAMGIDDALLGRHPFPGPGLAIRILGDITAEKVALLQEVDHIFIQGLKDSNLYDQVWQAGVMLLPVNSVGVMGRITSYNVCYTKLLRTIISKPIFKHLVLFVNVSSIKNDFINKKLF